MNKKQKKIRNRTSYRGFASLKLQNPEKLAGLASMGGKAAHAKGVAHRFTKEEASAAGKIGGKLGKRGKAYGS